MGDFQIVSDERRAEKQSGVGAPRSALWNAVRSGKTVLVTGRTAKSLNGARTALKGQGFRLHISERPDGLLVWASRIEVR
jgi:hypothetical protein